MARARLALALTVLAACALAAGQSTVGWRGDGTGQYPKASPALEWSTEKNVVWKTPLAAWSNASPIIVGERIFVCVEPSTLVCLNKADGAILWQQACGYDTLPAPASPAQAQTAALVEALEKDHAGAQAALAKAKGPIDTAAPGQPEKPAAPQPPKPAWAPPATHDVNGYSSPTPVSDGKNVYVVFGTGIAACYDMTGHRTWARMVERPSQGWGHSTSPVLVGGKLIVHVQKVWALKAADGQTAWTQDSPQAWGTPALARVGGKAVVITPAGDIFRADDGVKLASKVGALAFASPIVHDGTVYFAQDKACAVRLPETPEPVADLKPAWTSGGRSKRFYASAILHDGLLYLVNQAGEFAVLDAANGATLSARTLDLGGTTFPSITLAGGYLFVSSDTGTTVVLAPGKDPKQVARNVLAPFRSTP